MQCIHIPFYYCQSYYSRHIQFQMMCIQLYTHSIQNKLENTCIIVSSCTRTLSLNVNEKTMSKYYDILESGSICSTNLVHMRIRMKSPEQWYLYKYRFTHREGQTHFTGRSDCEKQLSIRKIWLFAHKLWFPHTNPPYRDRFCVCHCCCWMLIQNIRMLINMAFPLYFT